MRTLKCAIHSRNLNILYVLFSDESKFNVSFADDKLHVWRRTGERFDDSCATVVEHDLRGGGSVLVCGGTTVFQESLQIVLNGHVIAQRYINDVLRAVVVPVMRHNIPMFQQDNARPHITLATMLFLNQNKVDVLNWPSSSPDLSPIEHL